MMTTIEQRLRDVDHALALIQAGLSVDTCDPMTNITNEDALTEGLQEQASIAADAIYWVRLALEHGSLLALPAPTDDEKEDEEPAIGGGQ